MPKFSEIEFEKKADEAVKEFVARLKGQNFPIDRRLKEIFPKFQNLDPLLYSYDDGGNRILNQISLIAIEVGYNSQEADVFVKTLLGLEDGFGNFFGSLIRNIAIPLKRWTPPEDAPNTPHTLPPEILEHADGAIPEMWYLTADLLGEDSDPDEEVIGYSRSNPVKTTIVTQAGTIKFVVPTYVAVLIMATVVFTVLGWDKADGNIFKAIARGVRQVGRSIKKAFRKLFG